MKETQTTQKSKQFLWKRTNQSEHIYWSLKRVARNLLPIRKQREREEKSRSKAIERWTNERKPIELVCFLFWIETNEDTRTKTLRLSSLWLSIPFIHSVHFYLVLSSEDVCVCVKVQLLLLELMYDSSIAGATVFIWKLFPFAFLDSFVLLLLFFVLRKLLVSFNFKHSFVIVVEFLLALCIFFFRLLFLCPAFSVCNDLYAEDGVCDWVCPLSFCSSRQIQREREKETKEEKV